MSSISNVQTPRVAAVQSIGDPLGLDKAILVLQKTLAANLGWLDRVYGRARQYSEKRLGMAPRLYPKVYQTKGSGPIGEYLEVRRNDNFSATCFFVKVGPEQTNNFTPGKLPVLFTTRVALIFDINLEAVQPGDDSYNLELLKNQILQVVHGYKGARRLTVEDEDPNAIYRPFTVDQSKREQLMHPWAGLRYEFDLSYSEGFCRDTEVSGSTFDNIAGGGTFDGTFGNTFQ